MGRVGPWGLLIASVVVVSAIQVAYVVAGVVPSDGATQLSMSTLGLAFVLWVVTDARRRRIVPCHDFGFLVMLLMPVTLVWYAFWSRGGRRGLAVLAALFGLMYVPSLSALACWMLL